MHTCPLGSGKTIVFRNYIDKYSVNEECYTACSDYPNAFKPGLYCTDTTDGSRICANIHTFMKNVKAVNDLILKNVFRV